MGQTWLFLQQLYTKMQYGCVQIPSHVFTCIPKCSMAVYESEVAFLPVYESAVWRVYESAVCAYTKWMAPTNGGG